MNDDQNQQEALFEQALRCASPEARAAFLDDTCRSQPELRARLDLLLEGHFMGQGFLRDAPEARPAALDDQTGATIGRYKLLEKIGEGGFGVVYHAEQREPVKRRVALKIIKPGMDTKQVVARFEAERQALALMDHPGIARVFDGGATETGRPYFVMELVSGVPITTYCDEQQLSTEERLRLFVQVCDAVQHAHQKGIIHRDLKPSNILVTVINGRAVPKVIDFGVAKATQQELTEKTIFTQFQHFIGTPAYVSPEQAQLTSQDIDTRSDIYALGVLLYELLTGKTPFDGKELLAAGLDEMRRIIREVEPLKPSTRLTQERQKAQGKKGEKAAKGENDPLEHSLSTFNSQLSTDLDWIVMKCLEKDRTRRYATANGLANDIGRHLNNEPVVARPPSRLYRLQKTVQRNKLAFASGIVVLGSLIIGLGVSSWMFFRAQAEKKKAQTEADRSEQVAQFLREMLKAAGPGVARGRDAALLREILDQTAERVGRDLKDRPAIQGDLWFTLGSTYAEMGDYARAITNFQHAVESFRLAYGTRNTNLALARGRLGRAQSFNGDVATGMTNAQAGLDIARRCGDPAVRAACLVDVAYSQDSSGRGTLGAVPYLSEALTIYETMRQDPVGKGDCLRALANCFSDTDTNLVEAESLAHQALQVHQAVLEPDHPRLAADMFLLGQVLAKRGKAEEAEAVLIKTLDLYRKVHVANHPYRSIVVRFLVQALAYQDKWAEIDALLRKELEQPNVPFHGFENRRTNVQALVRERRWREAEQIVIEELGGIYAVNQPVASPLAVPPPAATSPPPAAPPPSPVPDPRTRVLEFLRENKLDEARAVAAEAIAGSASNRDYIFLLGDLDATLGNWPGAAEQFSRWLESKPDDSDACFNVAILLIAAGRHDQYRQHCHQFLDRFAATSEFGFADFAAKASLLLPVESGDFERACRLADFASTAATNELVPWGALVKSLAELRRGRFESAVQWSDRAISSDLAADSCKAGARFIQASALASLQRIDNAQTALRSGDELMSRRPMEPFGPLWWRDWTIANILRGEANAVIERRTQNK